MGDQELCSGHSNGSEPEQMGWKCLGLFRALELTDLSGAEEHWRMTGDGLGRVGDVIFKSKTWDTRLAKFIDAIGNVACIFECGPSWKTSVQGGHIGSALPGGHLQLETSVPIHLLGRNMKAGEV